MTVERAAPTSGAARSEWAPVAAYAALSAANQMLWLTFTPITTATAAAYGVSDDAVGWLAALFPLVYVLLALPCGALIDRAMPRWLGVGAVLTAAGAVIRIAGGGFPLLLAGQIVVALAQPLVLSGVTRLSATCLSPDDRPRGIAVSSAGIFGGMLVALASGATAGGEHLRALLGVQAVLAVAAAGWLLMLLRATHRPSEDSLRGTTAGALRAVWSDGTIRLLILLVCGGFGVFAALITWLQTLLEPVGVSASGAGVLLLLMVVAGVVACAVVPDLVARRNAAPAFILVSVIVGAAGFVVLAVAPGFAVGVPVMIALGAFLLADLPIILDLAERRARDAGGTVSALVWLAGNAAGVVMTLVVQALLDRPTSAFLLLGALLAAGTPFVIALRSRLSATPGGVQDV